MGIAASNLPIIATTVLELSILPLVMSLWFNSKSLLAFGMTLFVLGWDYCVRMAFNLGNPLSTYLADELTEATKIYVGVLGIMAILMAILGQFTAYVFDLPELLPIWSILPTYRRTPLSFKRKRRLPLSEDGTEVTDPSEKSEAQAATDYDNETGLDRNGIISIPRPTIHVVVCVILFLFAVVAPSIIYSMIMDNHKIAGVVCIVLIPAIGYVLLGIYCYYMTDLWVFGLTKKNVKNYNSHHAGSIRDGFIKQLSCSKEEEKETKERVLLTVLILGIIHVASNLVLGLVRYFQDDVDWNWITAAVIGAIILLLSLIVAVYFWYITNTQEQEALERSSIERRTVVQTTEEVTDEDDNDGQKTTSHYYGQQSAYSTNTKRNHNLGGVLLGDLTSK